MLGEVFRYTCAYRNFAKILGNINVYPNIIGVKPIHPKTLGGVNYTTDQGIVVGVGIFLRSKPNNLIVLDALTTKITSPII